MSAPIQRQQRSPPEVFPTEKDFEKFKPLLERYLRKWFTFLTSFPSSTSAGAGGIGEAPINGLSYERKNGAWVVASGGSGAITQFGHVLLTTTSHLTVACPSILAGSTILLGVQDLPNGQPSDFVVGSNTINVGVSFDIEIRDPVSGALVTMTNLVVAYAVLN